MKIAVISLDAELAWGFHDIDELPTTRFEGAKDGWLKLLDLFEEFEIPVAWAIVGHLFLDKWEETHEGLDSPKDWFLCNPGRTGNETSDWFGQNLARTVMKAEVDQVTEIRVTADRFLTSISQFIYYNNKNE